MYKRLLDHVTRVPAERLLRRRTLEDAIRGLARLVHDEYPADRTLAQIVDIWGAHLPAEQSQAIQQVEASGLID